MRVRVQIKGAETFLVQEYDSKNLRVLRIWVCKGEIYEAGLEDRNRQKTVLRECDPKTRARINNITSQSSSDAPWRQKTKLTEDRQSNEPKSEQGVERWTRQ